MAAEWFNRYIVSVGLISIYLKSNNTVLGHCVAHIHLIFQIKDNSWNAGLFLAYLQRFDVIPQPSGSWYTMGWVPDPTSSLYALKWATCWWASSSDMLIYPSIFAFPLLPLHRWSTTMHSDHTRSCLHSLHQTDLTYLIDTWFMIHNFWLLFLVSPTCALLRSDQSQALALRGQALHFGWALCSLSYLPFVFNLPVFYLSLRTSSQNSQRITHTSFPQNWDLALMPCTISHLSHTISHLSHHFTSHCTALQSHCLYPTPHLEMIPCPQITPSEPHRMYT